MTYMDTTRDVDLKYGNTYLKYNGSVFYVDRATSTDEGTIALQAKRLNNKNMWVTENIPYTQDMILKYPTLGAINLNTTAVFINRRPQRQARKALSLDTCTIDDLNIDERKLLRMHALSPNNKTLITSIFNPKYTQLTQAVAGIYNGTYLGRAVSKNFSVVYKAIPNVVCLLWQQYVVGEVDKDVCVHLVESVHYLQHDINTTLGAEVKCI